MVKKLSKMLSYFQESLKSSDGFINLEFQIFKFFKTNICFDLFFNWQTEKRETLLLLGICFLFQGENIVKPSDEFVKYFLFPSSVHNDYFLNYKTTCA